MQLKKQKPCGLFKDYFIITDFLGFPFYEPANKIAAFEFLEFGSWSYLGLGSFISAYCHCLLSPLGLAKQISIFTLNKNNEIHRF
ncbi:MAG: hypothetical protein EA412_04360 [Chitinophagaceae bacterium]|nr:MAG: hypothetical protein EA412_04360 [Chitinophagaceae bacterium]